MHFGGLKNPSCQTQAIRMYQASNTDAVANFDFFHGFTLWKIYHSVIFYYALLASGSPRKFRRMICELLDLDVRRELPQWPTPKTAEEPALCCGLFLVIIGPSLFTPERE